MAATNNNDASSKGVQIYITYARTPDIQFDTDYYLSTHMALVSKHWAPYGLKGWTATQFPEGDPSGLHTLTTLEWGSLEQFEKAWREMPEELKGDLKNYSNVVPGQWRGSVLGRG